MPEEYPPDSSSRFSPEGKLSPPCDVVTSGSATEGLVRYDWLRRILPPLVPLFNPLSIPHLFPTFVSGCLVEGGIALR